MAGDQDLVVETVREILSGFEPFVLTADRRWDAGLWGALADAGLTGVGLPEEAGGSGGELADAVAIVRTLAAGAAAVPVAEQLLVAGPALVAADLDLPSPEEPTTFAIADAVTVHPVDDGDGPGRFTLTGTAADVPWAGAAAHVALLVPAPAGVDGALLALVDASGLAATDAVNLAGEPRGSLVLDAAPASGALLTAAQAGELRARFALARAVQLAAALERVLAWTVQYAGERQQFGRPLGKFQAIQMELAEMAGEVTAVTALTDAAVQAFDRDENVVLAAA
jgi:acyl-CoA dehydrogenase